MAAAHQTVDRFLPLKPVELMILTVLAAGDRHGYGIRQDVAEQSGGAVELEAGNLYRHLRALEDAGLLSNAPPPRDETDERRVYYRLSPLGRRVLVAELDRLRALISLAEGHVALERSR